MTKRMRGIQTVMRLLKWAKQVESQRMDEGKRGGYMPIEVWMPNNGELRLFKSPNEMRQLAEKIKRSLQRGTR